MVLKHLNPQSWSHLLVHSAQVQPVAFHVALLQPTQLLGIVREVLQEQGQGQVRVVHLMQRPYVLSPHSTATSTLLAVDWLALAIPVTHIALATFLQQPCAVSLRGACSRARAARHSFTSYPLHCFKGLSSPKKGYPAQQVKGLSSPTEGYPAHAKKGLSSPWKLRAHSFKSGNCLNTSLAACSRSEYLYSRVGCTVCNLCSKGNSLTKSSPTAACCTSSLAYLPKAKADCTPIFFTCSTKESSRCAWSTGGTICLLAPPLDFFLAILFLSQTPLKHSWSARQSSQMGAIQPMKTEGYPAHQNWGQSSPWKLRAIQPMIVGSPAMLRGLSPKGLSSPSCKHQNHVSCVPCVCVLVCSNFNRIFNRIFNRFFNIRLFFFNRFFHRKLNIQLAKLLKKSIFNRRLKIEFFQSKDWIFSIEDALGCWLLADTEVTVGPATFVDTPQILFW